MKKLYVNDGMVYPKTWSYTQGNVAVWAMLSGFPADLLTACVPHSSANHTLTSRVVLPCRGWNVFREMTFNQPYWVERVAWSSLFRLHVFTQVDFHCSFDDLQFENKGAKLALTLFVKNIRVPHTQVNKMKKHLLQCFFFFS
ncbi:hypothetical protein J6590_069074 [Homalodisca vitripennis]|nr:hypothetical protein J6590_069074 [Homalodisca vitripennis]